MLLAAITLASALASAPCTTAAGQARTQKLAAPFPVKTCLKDTRTGDIFYFDRRIAQPGLFAGVHIVREQRGYWDEQVRAKTALVRPGSVTLNDAIVRRYNAHGAVTSVLRAPRMVIRISA